MLAHVVVFLNAIVTVGMVFICQLLMQINLLLGNESQNDLMCAWKMHVCLVMFKVPREKGSREVLMAKLVQEIVYTEIKNCFVPVMMKLVYVMIVTRVNVCLI